MARDANGVVFCIGTPRDVVSGSRDGGGNNVSLCNLAGMEWKATQLALCPSSSARP